MKKEEQIIMEELEKKYWMLISDWIPTDNGKMKKQINKNKRSLFRSAILEGERKLVKKVEKNN